MHLLYSREITKMMRDVGLVETGRAVPAAVQPGPDPRRRRRADEQVTGQRPGSGRSRRTLWRRYDPAVPDVHGAVGPGRPVELDRDRRRPSLPQSDLDPGPRSARRRGRRSRRRQAADRAKTPRAAERSIRMAAHRTLRVVTEEYAGFRFNTMVAHLMELANTLFRYRGTEVAAGPAWDEAMGLLLLMLAPAAPHISDELWNRRRAASGAPESIDPPGDLAIRRQQRDCDRDPRGPDPGQWQGSRPGHGSGRDRPGRARAAGPRSRTGSRSPRRTDARAGHPRRGPAGQPGRSGAVAGAA